MAHQPLAGVVIGNRYELLELAGEGGMAKVWKARVRGERGFEKLVAIKHMHAHLATQGHYVAMFAEEARVGATLKASNLVEIYDYFTDGNDHFVAMEWVAAVDLGTWLRWHKQLGNTTDWSLCAGIGVGLLRALAAAHERKRPDGAVSPIVHRDVSPHNILLAYDGRVKVIDFGLALAADRQEETTDPGVVKGKMSYLAPEIAKGARPTPATDVFAAAAVIWESLAGQRLFEAANDYDVFVKVRDCLVPPIRSLRPDLPTTLATVVHSALVPVPADRPSATELANALATVMRKSHDKRDLREVLAESIARMRRSSQAEGVELVAHDDPTPATGLFFAPAKKLREWGERLFGRKRPPTKAE